MKWKTDFRSSDNKTFAFLFFLKDRKENKTEVTVLASIFKTVLALSNILLAI